MTYQLDDFQIGILLESACLSAIARHDAIKEPYKDLLSKGEAEEYVRIQCDRNGLYPAKKTGRVYTKKTGAVILKQWVERGYLKGCREGAGKNSPIFFKKSEIIDVVSKQRALTILNSI